MNKTKIEWVKNPDGSQGFTSNPIKGYCPVACYYCYSRQDYDRFGWDKTIRWDADEMDRLMRRRKPAGIFIGSMHEVFLDEYIERGWTQGIIQYAEFSPEHRIYLLTKQPQNLIKFSPFPNNCWVGVTATDVRMLRNALFYLDNIEAKVKYISFEPLLNPISDSLGVVNWVIIGAQTNPLKLPNMDWVREIITACNGANIPVFIKDNILNNCQGDLRLSEMRQEMPGVLCRIG